MMCLKCLHWPQYWTIPRYFVSELCVFPETSSVTNRFTPLAINLSNNAPVNRTFLPGSKLPLSPALVT